MNEDITFCSNTSCKVMKCERNQKNIRHTLGMPHSIAELEGTIMCYKEGEKDGGEKGKSKRQRSR